MNTPKTLKELAPKMTLSVLAKKAGLSASVMSLIFSGERVGSIPTINKIAKVLKKSPGEMLDYLTKVRARNVRAKKRKTDGRCGLWDKARETTEGK